MISGKIEIDIDRVIQENNDECENIVSKFKNIYLEYCVLEDSLVEEQNNISKEKNTLEIENKDNSYDITRKKENIEKNYLIEKKELNSKLEKQLETIELEYRKQNGNLSEEIKNAGIFKVFIWFFTKYDKRKKEEIKNEKSKNISKANHDNSNLLEELKNKKNNLLKQIDNENKEIIHVIELNVIRVKEIEKRLEEIKRELYKLSIKKEFIKCRDKDKYSEISDEMTDILELKKYPSIHRIKTINNEIKTFIIKYKEKISLLEDNKINIMVENYNKNILVPELLKPRFMEKELKEADKLLSDIDGKSLDSQQRNAVVTDEDNNLIVAGAGSGKTLTISAKVKYLVSRLKVNPKEILLITFTKKAAEEMEERIAKKLGIEVKVKTFHSLGYELMGFFENGRPEIYDDIDTFTDKFILEHVYKDENLKKDIFNYFTTYMNDYVNPEDFDCLGEYYRANKSNSLEAIEYKLRKIEANRDVIEFNKWLDDIKKEFKQILKEKTVESSLKRIDKFTKDIKYQLSKMDEDEFGRDFILTELLEGMDNFKLRIRYILEHKDKQQHITMQKKLNKKIEGMYLDKITLQAEKVKSIEELIIANYLFACGIDYIYEGNYEFDTVSSSYRQYKPDFYLPKYKIYIEHFGINENGRCPQFSKPEEIKYLEGIQWKRELHKENGTIMEETYSFEHKQGQLINKLNSIFKKYNIPIKKLTSEELTKVIMDLNTDKEFKEFYKLLNTFLSLFKSCNFKESDIDRFISEAKLSDNEYTKAKHILFLNIFKKYYKEYVKELKEENKIDFNDMINKATNYITEKYLPSEFKFKYIIIDEFQDISVARYKLINAIKKDTGAKIMAVGDDWQSIYRFTGSDIAIFTKFAKYFGETETLMIEKTYRNSQQLIDIAGKFVMNNPDQIRKSLKSDKILEHPVILVDYTDNLLKEADENKNSLVRRVMFILNSLEKKQQTVLLLGRNNFDINEFKESEFFRVLEQNNEIIVESNLYPHLEIKFMSVHKSKGIEADEVIIINNKNNIIGFPNKMVSDSILSYVMTEEESFTFAEERRLFYVAITRTKNHCYLMCPDENSNFTEELKSYKNIEDIACDDKEEKIYCPICKTGHLVKRIGANKKEFYGCNNFPQCGFKTSNMTNVKSKVRCPSCGNFMSKRKGPYGDFYGCNSYPHCKTKYKVEEFERLDRQLSGESE